MAPAVGVAGVIGLAGGGVWPTGGLGCTWAPGGTNSFALGFNTNSLALGFNFDFEAIEAETTFAGELTGVLATGVTLTG